jgi:outer membrane protein assembly factor BamB
VSLAGVVHVPSGIGNAPQAGTYRVDTTSGTVLGLSGPLQTTRLSVAGGTIATLWRAQSLGTGFAVINWKYQPTMRADFGDPPSGRDFAIIGDRVMWNSGPWAAGYSPACPQYPGLPDEACLPDWAVNLGGNAVGIANLGGDRVVYSDVTGTVTALLAATGTLAWTAETGSALSTPVAVAGGMVLVTTDDNRLLALSATDGTLQWQAPLTGHPGGPVAAGDVVYVPVGSDVVAFALTGCGAATCQPIATLPVGTAVTEGPIVDDGRVVVGTADGRVVAFGLNG